MSSKQIQKFKDEIEALKKKNRDQEEKIQNLEEKNRDQKEALEKEIQYLKQKNLDLRSINSNYNSEIQRLKKKNHELVIENQEVVNENQDLQKEKFELVPDKSKLTAKIIEDRNKIQDPEQQDVLSAQFENLNVNDYSHINPSPVKVDTSQPCTIWWCPVHSNFATIINRYIPTTDADKLIVRRARARFKYWNNKDDGERCWFCQRKSRDSNKYPPPSDWPK